MRAGFAAAVFLFACAHTGPGRDAGLAKWQAEHPEAARQLCAFNQQYPGMSNRLRQWTLNHPIDARQLLEWAASNPGSPMPEMFRERRPADPGMYILYDWASQNPKAAQALADDPRALRAALDTLGC